MARKRRIGGNTWVYILVGLMLLYNVVFETGGERRPDIAPIPQAGDDLPPADWADPGISVEAQAPRNALGTAFAINDDGWWLTARHVVDGCDLISVAGRAARSVVIHPRADVALIKADALAPPLRFNKAPLKRNQQGFHFGFPQGKPAAVESLLIGRSILNTHGYRVGSEPTLSWAERRRVPDFDGPLGGISGGPTLNGEGEIIGVTIAGSPRRGRVESAAPESLEWLVNGRVGRLNLTRGDPISSANLAGRENFLRERKTVAKVYCRVTKS